MGLGPINKILIRKKIPQDYILRLDFDNNINDKSVNQNHCVGNPIYTVGKNGRLNNAILFDGNYGIKTQNDMILQGTKWTYSFWLKPEINQNTKIIIERGTGVTTDAQYIDFNEAGQKPNINVSDKGIKQQRQAYENLSIFNDGNYHHLLIMYNRDLGVPQTVMYVDNQLCTQFYSVNISDINESISVQYPLYIGARHQNSFLFKGSMQNLRVYNRLLSDVEITKLYRE